MNLNDLSSSSHFGIHINPQHHIAEQSGIQLNMMQVRNLIGVLLFISSFPHLLCTYSALYIVLYKIL